MTAYDFVVVANRLPVDRVEGRWVASPGGLVTALAPVLQKHTGCWVGWPGEPGADFPPFENDGLALHPVVLDEHDYEAFYEGFSNSTLWPLYHDLIVTPIYDASWWECYREVNHKFARATADVAAPGATVWVQDYQLQLVPGLLKEMRPDLRIGFFLHIPFPATDLFRQLPWRDEILRGLQGADLIGFQRTRDEENFSSLSGACDGMRTGTFPISIDTSAYPRASAEDIARVRDAVGNAKTIMLGVDRLDYTKGILQRLNALEELLEAGAIENVAMIQVATPSRERIGSYRTTRSAVEEAVGRINGRHGSIGRPVVHYHHHQIARDELRAYYSTADVMLVTPFKDGMNLVAKEYVACHPDGSGALVLSEFAGAAVELHRAHLCNPFDIESIKAAITRAVEEQGTDAARDAMTAMNTHVNQHDVARWAGSFLEGLADA